MKLLKLTNSLKLKPLLSRHKKPLQDESPVRYKLFSDQSAGSDTVPDRLERDRIAHNVADTVSSSSGAINFLIAGEWGIGKTSILNSIETMLASQGIYSVWFSPWQYSGTGDRANAISRAFLTQLANRLGKSYVCKELYIKRQIESERSIVTQLIMLIQLLVTYMVFLAVIFSALSLLQKYVPLLGGLLNNIVQAYGLKDRSQLLLSLSAIFALPPLGQYFLQKIREKGEVEKVTSPELLETKFNIIVHESVRCRWLQIILSWWEAVLADTPLYFMGQPLHRKLFYRQPFTYEKLVIFVDDLDRCEQQEVQEFLLGMKTFLGHPKIYYVIAADREKLKSKANDEEPEFLRKIVQLDWNVPYLKSDQIERFIRHLLLEAGAPESLIDAKDAAYMFRVEPNPRKIKYYIRRLLFLLNYEGYKSE